MAKLHTGRFEVVALAGSWHGMTAGGIVDHLRGGASRLRSRHAGHDGLPAPNCYRCPCAIAATAAT